MHRGTSFAINGEDIIESEEDGGVVIKQIKDC